ncbi:hypothetical protein P170DRAFT_133678 [Aspergillus steynii IBT 23096]|uniref:Uncharacterized protein n=1 Tax=Aspergillus steynii IBT 23096 TaxID=1392250 RepID=A0A2I2GAK0_9EURO|nr:uncharacterized protein P170DRAFT_133678 [Aspergillus steynii IBT 23096]PLB49909.1 hypothetical protein P170DRAFT_133678 [Aspergillus steynii IBT 23096]
MASGRREQGFIVRQDRCYQSDPTDPNNLRHVADPPFSVAYENRSRAICHSFIYLYLLSSFPAIPYLALG